jgi:hypothetical protein
LIDEIFVFEKERFQRCVSEIECESQRHGNKATNSFCGEDWWPAANKL